MSARLAAREGHLHVIHLGADDVHERARFDVYGDPCARAPEVVTTEPSGSNGRYDDCRRAARDYCEHVVRPSDDQEDRCVAEQTFVCIRGGS